MRQRITVLLPAVAFAVVAFSISIGGAAQAADDCLAQPKSTAPNGQHWYYHLDRVKNRQCWFLAAEGSHARRSAASKPSAADAAESPSAPVPAKKAQARSAPPHEDADTNVPTMRAPDAPAMAPERAPFDFTGRWPGPPRQAVPSMSQPVPVDAAPPDTVGIENAAPDAVTVPDTPPMPATEARPAAVKLAEPQFSVRPGALLALLAGALALAAALVHMLFERAARHRVRRARATRNAIWDTPDPWRRPARVPARPPAPPARPAAPLAPPLAPSSDPVFDPFEQDRSAELEQTLQRLLDNWRSRAA